MNVTIPTGGTATEILTNKPGRKGFVIGNNSGSTVYLSGVATVTADEEATGGWPLKDGKDVTIGSGGGMDLAQGAVFAVHAEAGDKKLSIWEF